MAIKIKTQEEIEGIRESSKLAAQTLNYIEPFVQEGVDTETLDQKIYNFIARHNAKPAPLNYNGFPKSSCISLNEVVCHGIPSKKTVLQNGDILNIDITTNLNGYYGDTSRMFTVGEPSDQARNLIDVTKKCLDLGIEQCYPNNQFGNIGYGISTYAEAHGYSVVYEFCGHGVGTAFHEEPEIAHTAAKDSGPLMKPGMVFTIEPMINQGKARVKVDKNDEWTATTIDNKLSAQFEHTILITGNGSEVTTDLKNEYAEKT
ncbi:MAG: type I methionyl aminopeptidase [Bacteroidetes bacterium SW_10_40_5]|nr:MAG: type I methionyl aminopeptidase [Bacteroidetes bacterium SW_10_40_5]